MKLRIDLGSNGARKIINWYQPVEDFPRYFSHEGKKWEWFFYDTDKSGQYDYVLIYSELPTYDPNFYSTMPSWDEIFGGRADSSCVCGSVYTSFLWDHMRFCPLWTPW